MKNFDFEARFARAQGKRLFTYALAAFVGLLYFNPTQPAQACGGFFCDAVTLTPVYQAGERVVFDRRNGSTTMHVEISYEGDSDGFGWLLPMDKALVDENGVIRPLEEILQVSTRSLFDTLQNSTNPIYRVNNSFDAECDNFAMFGGGPASRDSNEAAPEAPGVEVLQSANIGPYGAQIIEAENAADLYKWLEEQGYLEDPNAKEMLDHYVSKDFVFLGLRLLSNKDAGDIRPVQLNLGDTDACVPLRLTAIAATTDMPMLVWVLGDHRAIPKNFMHAVVNPKALNWPGASNYVDVVTEAIDSIVGRAFVTEYAGSTDMMQNAFNSNWVQNNKDELIEAETLEDIVNVADKLNARSDDEVRSVLESFIEMPEGLIGYPYNDCCFDGSCWSTSDFVCEENDEHETTPEEFYGYISWWMNQLEESEITIDGDVEAIKDELIYSYFEPRERIQAMFDAAPYMTRFFTTISDDEMTRDPMFAQNPDLPDVPLTNELNTVVHFDEDCYEAWLEVNYPDGTMTVLSCEETNCMFGMPVIPAIPDVDPLLWVEVMDEAGDPRPFNPDDAEEVDQLLDNSVPGSPTLPDWYDLQEPEDKTVNANTDLPGQINNPGTPGPQPTGGLCSAGKGQNSFNMFWILALALVGLQATRRRQTN